MFEFFASLKKMNYIPSTKIIFLCIFFGEILIITYLSLYFLNETKNLNIQFTGKIYNSLPRYCNTSYHRKSNNSNLVWELMPYYDGLFDGCAVRLPLSYIKINSDGFRGREFSVEKSQDTYRIIVLGDSFIFGHGLELNETYPKILERKLNKLNNRINYEVLNFGVPGYNTMEEVEMFKVKGLKYKPDMVIVVYVANDILDELLRPKILDELAIRYKDEFKENLTINARLELNNKINIESEAMLWNIVWIKPFNESFKIVSLPLDKLKLLQEEEKFSVLIIIYEKAGLQKDVKNGLLKISQKNDWKIIDMSQIFSLYPIDSIVLHPLDGHPSLFAHEIASDYTVSFMINQDLIPLSLKELKLNN